MAANRRGDVPLQVFLRLVLGVLVEFVLHVLVDRVPLAERVEVVTHHARLERPLVAVKGRPPGIFRVGRVAPGAVGPDDLDSAEVEGRGLGVGDVRLARLVDEDAAGRFDPSRPAQAQHPAHHVEHVNAHVADDPVRIFHERPPAARMDHRVVRPSGRGAGPHRVIQVRRRIGVGRVGRVAHVVITIDLDERDFAELPFADDPVARLDQVRRAPALGADLHDPLVLASGGEHRLAFADVDADRLLDINVGPALDGRDHRQGVPVVGRGDQDEVKVFAAEHLAVVGEQRRRLLRLLPRGDQLGRVGEHRLVHVAERDDLDGRDLDQAEEVGLAVPARADQSHAPRLAVVELCALAEGRGRQGQARRAGLDELASIHGRLSWEPRDFGTTARLYSPRPCPARGRSRQAISWTLADQFTMISRGRINHLVSSTANQTRKRMKSEKRTRLTLACSPLS